jgi:hypothetical protein
MTAIITYADDEGVTVWTDAVHYDKDGVARFFLQKADIVLHLPAIIASRGSGHAGVLAKHYLSFCNTFDEAAGRLADITAAASHEAELLFGDPVNINLLVAGLSDREGGLQRLTCNYRRDRDSGELIGPTVSRSGPREITVEPDIPEGALRDAELIGENGGLFLRDSASAIAIMEIQRRIPYEYGPAQNGCGSIVGGFIQETRLFADGYADSRIIHRWPEDRIGERLAPAGAILGIEGLADAP